MPIGPDPEPDVVRAHRMLTIAVLAFLVGVAIASPWDVWWHTQKSFETFWSPPHLLLYASILFGAATAAGIAANPRLRAAFGKPLPGSRRWLAFPPPLILLGAGFVMMIVAGGLDDYWHSTFGQDETRWSYPHGLLAFGAFSIAIGSASCRMALAPARPFGRLTALSYGLVVIAYTLPASLGPMTFNITPETNARVAAMPGFWGPDTQGLMALIDRWTLDRTNVVFPAMAAVWATAALAVVHVIDGRPRSVLLTASAAMVAHTGVGLAWAIHTNLLGSPSAWMPLPVLVPAVVWVGIRGKVAEPHLRWALGGLSMGLATAAIYHPTALGFALASFAAPAGWAAGWLGEEMARQLRTATARGFRYLLVTLCAVLPILTGSLDLALRLA